MKIYIKDLAMKDNILKLQEKERELRCMLFIMCLTLIVCLGGCATKPEVVTKVEYQEKIIPVRCNVTIPEKPVYDPSDLDTAKGLTLYYSSIEVLLKGCVYGVAK